MDGHKHANYVRNIKYIKNKKFLIIKKIKKINNNWVNRIISKQF